MQYKCFIVDDEKDARDAVRFLIEQLTPQLKIVGEAANISDSLKLIKQSEPQLVFLDIDLEDGSGFDLLKLIPIRNFKVIFVTGHSDLAIKAFRFNALDYILKPIDPTAFQDAISKALETIDKQGYQDQLTALLKTHQQEKPKNLVLNTADDIYFVEIDDIVRCESEVNYTMFYLSNGKKIMVSKSLKEYNDLLEPLNFFRTHQSHLVNLNFIHKFHKKDGGYLILKDGSNVPVSTRKKELLIEKINQL
ncbi:MAG: response regulator transcription factor [Bacteroidales bacterium]|nr:response regulator transcription factor [Bacteroidales bacterium]